MKVSTEIDNNFGYEKITQLVDNIPLNTIWLCIDNTGIWVLYNTGIRVQYWYTSIVQYWYIILYVYEYCCHQVQVIP
jgi:hypothetical protein